jgi:DNA-binding response OmpR family regulator
MEPTFAILAVDTDAAALAELVELLRGAGYKATGAPTFETARQLLETAVFDLLITDLRLMAHNGLHLVVRGRVLQRAPTAIVLSSVPDSVDEIEARRLGANYLARPVDPDSLLAFAPAIPGRSGPHSSPQWLRSWRPQARFRRSCVRRSPQAPPHSACMAA